MRLRDKRERQALKYLTSRRCASASDLGAAATMGERATRPQAVSVLGFKIGNHFVQRGFARVDQLNRYVWVRK